jgi:hypothetical protein
LATMWRSSVEFTKHTRPSPGTKARRSGSDPRSIPLHRDGPVARAEGACKGRCSWRCSAAEYRECECHATKKTGARRWRRGCAFLHAAPNASPDTAPDSALDAAIDAAQRATEAALRHVGRRRVLFPGASGEGK